MSLYESFTSFLSREKGWTLESETEQTTYVEQEHSRGEQRASEQIRMKENPNF